MKRFLWVFLVLLICSCSVPDSIELSPDESKTAPSHSDSGMVYVASSSSKTYHFSSCHVAERISEENRFETAEKEFFTKRGFSPCSVCKPDKY